MSDANKELTLNQLAGAAFGAAGQRCMALSTAVFVGEANSWLPDLKDRAQKLKVNAGNDQKMVLVFTEYRQPMIVYSLEFTYSENAIVCHSSGSIIRHCMGPSC